VAALAAGQVVLVTFPFSDLSDTKLRPALVLADAGRGDCILCQITSNSFSDHSAVELTMSDFQTGSLHRTSYARPNKVFTANQSLVSSRVGKLNQEAFQAVISALIRLLSAGV
jgi:mRNA interferase MazF